MPSLLVFTPTYRNLLRPETVESVEAQRFDGFVEYVVSDHNPFDGDRNMANVLAQYQQARSLTLDGGYDALVTIEHDMRIPANALQTLWDTDADVVYATYVLRHGTRVLNAWRYESPKSLGMSLSLYPDELAQAQRQKTVRVSGIGFGCTLIRRRVLEAIPFRGADNSGPDMPFAGDCLRAGLLSVARFDVFCDHYHDGEWLTMDGLGDPVARFLPAVDINVNVKGASVRLSKNVHTSLPLDTARELARAGYGSITNGADDGGRETAVTEARETAESPIAKRRSKRA